MRPGVGKEASIVTGYPERTPCELSSEDVDQLVPDDRMGISLGLHIDLAAPGLGDEGVGGTHERPLLRRALEDKYGDGARPRCSQPTLRCGHVRVAIVGEPLDVRAPEGPGVDHVTAFAVEVPPEGLRDRSRRLGEPKVRRKDGTHQASGGGEGACGDQLGNDGTTKADSSGGLALEEGGPSKHREERGGGARPVAE